MGIAHPIWGGNNEFFRLRGPRAIPLFEQLVTVGEEREVKIDFDCGFTPCMFSQDFVESHPDMFRASENGHDAANSQPADSDDFVDHDHGRHAGRERSIGMRCDPVVDILPEGDCIACYALSRFLRIPLRSGGSRNDLVRSFANKLLPMLPMGIHRECEYCNYQKRSMCSGGCRARRALRLRPNELNQLYLESTDE